MTKIQNDLLLQIKEIDRICISNHIQYTVIGGTLLGTVREHGFISWDNDADIAMLRKDYILFRDALRKGNSTFELIENLTGGAAQFVGGANETDSIQSSTDIFIYDYISENKLSQKLKKYGIIVLQAMLKDKRTIHLVNANDHSLFQRLVYYFFFLIGCTVDSERKRRWYDKFASSKLVGSKKSIFLSNDSAKYLNRVIPEYYMQNCIRLSFEDIEVSVLSQYDAVLRMGYGDDYMIPVYYDDINKRHEKFRKTVFEKTV